MELFYDYLYFFLILCADTHHLLMDSMSMLDGTIAPEYAGVSKQRD